MSELDELLASVRAAAAKYSDHDARRRIMDSELGYDPTLWRVLCEIGVAALAIPEEYGGVGVTNVESFAVVAELASTLVHTPLLASAVLCGQTLLALDDAHARAALLPGIADGTTIATLCIAGGAGNWSGSGVRCDDGKLSGTAHYVLDGAAAEVLIVVAGDTGTPSFHTVDPTAAGVTVHPTPSLDPTRPLARIEFRQAPARQLTTADPTAVLDRLHRVAAAALAAEQSGAAAGCLRTTVDYTKTRVQFGRPIGSFQALKHRMADLHVLVESARSIAHAAATLDPTTVAAARVHCTDTFNRVAAESIQLHGGIAITWEHDAHLYFKRAHADSRLFGTASEWLRRMPV